MAKMLRREIAAQVMEHYCEHDAHGYSQVSRLGNGIPETITLSDGSTVTVTGGDRDCSSLVETCYVAAGVLPHRLGMWTGNEAAILLAYGFKEVSVHNVERGDVLWVKGHTAIYLGDGYIGEAHHGDYYGGLDGVAGDQDGTEVRLARYYPSHWTTAYHYDYSDEADELTDIAEYYMTGKQEKDRRILMKHCKKIDIYSPEEMYIQCDGENFKSKELHLQIVEKGLKLKKPQ